MDLPKHLRWIAGLSALFVLSDVLDHLADRSSAAAGLEAIHREAGPSTPPGGGSLAGEWEQRIETARRNHLNRILQDLLILAGQGFVFYAAGRVEERPNPARN